MAGAIKPIRERIRNGTTKPPVNNVTTPYRQFPLISPNETMNPIQSHKIITFNYKMQNNILPFPSLREQWGIDGTANCTLCDRHRETEPHLFYYCEKISHFWTALGNITCKNFEHAEVMRLTFNDGIENKLARIFLTSTSNYRIWCHRNAIKFGSQLQFSLTGILKDVYYQVKSASEFESTRTRPREPFHTELLDLLQKFQMFVQQYRIIPNEGIT